MTGSFLLGDIEDGGNGTLYVSGSHASLTHTNNQFVVEGSDSVVTVRDGGLISAESSSGMTLAPDATGSGTVNINGTPGSRGVLETHFVDGGVGNGQINFDGGILRALSSQSNFLHNFEAGDMTVGSGGAFIDTNGFDSATSNLRHRGHAGESGHDSRRSGHGKLRQQRHAARR